MLRGRSSQPAVPPVPRDWRQDLVGVGAFVIVLGAWLVVSPFLLDYGSGDASWNPILIGLAATAVALVQMIRRVSSPTPGWILMAMGAWLFASGFLLAASSAAVWNARGAGTLMFFLGSVSVAATVRPRVGG